MSNATEPGLRRYESSRAEAGVRGQEFGEANREQIAATVAHYKSLFLGPAALGAGQLKNLAERALTAIDSWAPEVGREIRGLATGSNQELLDLVALNARTEILAAGTATLRGECSTVVHLCNDESPYPEAQQNWDWYSTFAGDWLVWSIELEDGRRVETLTEYGIVAKAGCNSAGVGLLFNILHHVDDGAIMGVPIHVVARKILETAEHVADALSTVASATLSASTTLTLVSGGDAGKVAVSVETSPNDIGFVFPDESGLLVHTNHFLSDPLRLGDLEHRHYPDTVLRLDALARSMRRHSNLDPRSAISASLSSTVGGSLAVCCRPDPRHPSEFQFSSLAHIRLDLARCRVIATPGGPPCSA